MIATGNQLKAARAIVGLNQAQLAKLAGVNTSTISTMEAKGSGTLTSSVATVRMVTEALTGLGVEVASDRGWLGIQYRQP